MKQNQKLETKFFKLFQVLNSDGKQAYKLELPAKWKIYNVFHLSLLEQDTTKKRQINKFLSKFEMGNDKEYKIKAIQDSTIYVKKEDGYLSELYYLIYEKVT